MPALNNMSLPSKISFLRACAEDLVKMNKTWATIDAGKLNEIAKRLENYAAFKGEEK